MKIGILLLSAMGLLAVGCNNPHCVEGDVLFEKHEHGYLYTYCDTNGDGSFDDVRQRNP